MNAIPCGAGHWRNESRLFRHWLLDNGHEWFAKRFRGFDEYWTRGNDVMLRIGITPEKYDEFLKLRREFNQPRQAAVSAAVRREESRRTLLEARAAIPEKELRARMFPKRFVPRGFAG